MKVGHGHAQRVTKEEVRGLLCSILHDSFGASPLETHLN